MKRWKIALGCLLILGLNLYSGSADETLPTIAAQISANNQLTMLNHLLQLADPAIRAWLDNPDNRFTLFAPTDSAWQRFFDEMGVTLEEYAQRPNALDEKLRYHIVPMLLISRQDFETWFYTCDDLGTMLPDSRLVVAWNYETGTYTVNGSFPTAAPLTAANGLIYLIDEVLPEVRLIASSSDHTPDGIPTKTPEPRPPRLPAAAEFDIQTVLENDGRFTTLLHLLSAFPRYQAILKSDGLYMLFAPTDAAFQRFFDERPGLTRVTFTDIYGEVFVPYSILPGYFSLDTLLEVYRYATPNYCPLLHGQVAEIAFDAEQLTIDGVPLTGEALYARNGIIFVTGGVHLKTPFRG